MTECTETLWSDFFSKVVISRNTSCWVWTDHLEFGYGIFSIRGTIFRAHRFAYIIYKGAIEEGLVIDHLCRNKRCVNPDHLEAVTQSLNITRESYQLLNLLELSALKDIRLVAGIDYLVEKQELGAEYVRGRIQGNGRGLN